MGRYRIVTDADAASWGLKPVTYLYDTSTNATTATPPPEESTTDESLPDYEDLEDVVQSGNSFLRHSSSPTSE